MMGSLFALAFPLAQCVPECINRGYPGLHACAGSVNSKELQKFALEAFPSSLVTRLSSVTVQAFMATDPRAPTIILFTDKEETPPVFAALSVNLRKYKYRFADVHSSDTDLMQQFHIQKVRPLPSAMQHSQVGRQHCSPRASCVECRQICLC
jgi:hypothetical protein